jgi:hypothetical protein
MNRLALLAIVALAGCEAAAASAPTRAYTSAASPSVASASLASAPLAPAPAGSAAASLGRDAAALTHRSLGGSSLAAMQLLASADGRTALASVVACALPAGASITVIARDGTPYSFTGSAGVDPGWAQHAPSLAERQRVAACLARPTHLARR